MFKRVLLFLFSAFFLAGCTHNISITPTKYSTAEPNESIGKTCVLVIPEEKLKIRIEQGVWGDPYAYAPYKDLRTALTIALKKRCSKVIQTTDAEYFLAANQNVVFLPEITTHSDEGVMLWPPTSFDVYLNVDLKNKLLEQATHLSSQGHGSATFSQMTKHPGYAGSYAMEVAVQKIMNQVPYDKINKLGE